MPTTTYTASSPYGTTPQTSWYLGRLSYRAIPPSSDDQIMTLDPKYNNRPDLLSYDLYGTMMYWWIFGVRNPDLIRDPVWDMVGGMTIYVPTLNTLKKALGS